MTDHVVVLYLLLTTGTLAVLCSGYMDKYRRENGTFANTPTATVSAASKTTCAIRCTSMELWSCGGFTYHNGTCDLYRGNEEAAGVNPWEAAPPLEVDTGSEPRSYRRLQATDPGEGILTCSRLDSVDKNIFCAENGYSVTTSTAHVRVR